MGDIVEVSEVEDVAEGDGIELEPGEAKEVARAVEDKLEGMIRDAIRKQLQDRHNY